MKKRAVVLFNLGGPDELDAVQPFLFNLFSDKAIISIPQPMRYVLAKLISKKRAPIARDIYSMIGGRSPILEQTKMQADALQAKLGKSYKVFTCMRYWKPMAKQVVQEVKAYAPDEVVLLPLYPQYSTTTTASSFKQWDLLAARAGLSVPTFKICCYPTQTDFIAAHAELIGEALAAHGSDLRILFSAHGLPEKIIKGGDPYQWQVEQTATAIVAALGKEALDYRICYQSRVGPLKWIGPSTEEEIRNAGAEGRKLMVVPVAFVSEHSETLVELDREYAHLAQEAGVPEYVRVPALCVQPEFIVAMARLCVDAGSANPIACHNGGRICPARFSQCPQKAA